MCRLFGLHAGRELATATLWLLNAPDSLSEQSRRNPDGTGVGVFGPDGRPIVDKQPMAAWEDKEFATEAHELRGTTFIAHVRYASTGGTTLENTTRSWPTAGSSPTTAWSPTSTPWTPASPSSAPATWCTARPTPSGCSR